MSRTKKLIIGLAATATAVVAVPVAASAQDAASVPATATEAVNSAESWWCQNLPQVLQNLCSLAF